MKRLLHCVFRHDGTDASEVVHNHRLAVATTPWVDGEPVDMARLLAYECAIARLHATRTVVPLRFGCIQENESRILHLLEEREAEFNNFLDQLDGLAEMGLRAWWKSPVEEPIPTDRTGPGAQYLAAARRRHSGLRPIEEQWAHGICGSMKGFYEREKREAHAVPEGRLVSLHFLVAKRAADVFGERVRRLSFPGEMKFLISGPWPPHNFADYV